MLDEPITVVPYRSDWAMVAAEEIARLSAALGGLVVACEHFGSTSIPGCDAKPILDIMLGVVEWPVATAVKDSLQRLGYADLGEAGVPGRSYFRARGIRGFDFNLAVTVYQGSLWRTNLLVRDLLRREPQLVVDYVREKRAALRAGCNTLLSYSQHKSAFMKRLIARALEPRSEP